MSHIPVKPAPDGLNALNKFQVEVYPSLGLYYSPDSQDELLLVYDMKDNTGIVSSRHVATILGASVLITNSNSNSSETPTDAITTSILLKAIAVTQKPELAFKTDN